MKRWLVWSFFSIVTFLVGVSIVAVPRLRTSIPTVQEIKIDQTTVNSQLINGDEDFVSEFHGLPDIGEIETSNLNTKLIDVTEYDEGQGIFEYRKSEILALSGEQWLGLFNINGQFSFKPVTTRVQLLHTPTDPDYEASYTLKFRQSSVPPLFVTKPSKFMKPGLVQAAYFKDYLNFSDGSEKGNLRQGFNKQISAFDKSYVLRVSKGLTTDGTKVNVLVLEHGNFRQIVTYNLFYKDSTTTYDSIGELLFAGDLDGDQLLDLYISDFGFEKGGFSSQLFLSSEADSGQLIKLVATFSTAGC